MPTYTVKDPRSNLTVQLTGDSPPTEQELNQVFATLNAQRQPQAARTWGDTAADVGTGIAKGASNTVIGLGQLFDKYVPGVHQLSEAVNGPVAPDTYQKARDVFATPTNTPQKVGMGIEQMGEFFVPVGAVGKLGKAAEVAKSGVLTMAQGGSPAAGAVSAGLTAVLPGASALKTASSKLQQGAEKEMAQALGATKEGMKAQAAKLAPDMLKRGVKGSRQAMLEQSSQAAKNVGAGIGRVVEEATKAGETVSGDAIRKAMWTGTASLHVLDAAGEPTIITGAEPVMRRIEKLDTFIAKLGPDIPIDKAQKIKTALDRIVSKAGLYGQRATASATDNANAWATREAASAFRDVLSKNPDLATLNKEYEFWKGLKTVLTETNRRTQAQAGTGLVAAGSGGTGAVIGAMTGDNWQDRAKNAVLGGLVGRNLVRAIQSPAFRTSVSGPVKARLADALASGNAERVNAVAGKIIASMPSEAHAMATP